MYFLLYALVMIIINCISILIKNINTLTTIILSMSKFLILLMIVFKNNIGTYLNKYPRFI